jgi:hypothetical protein
MRLVESVKEHGVPAWVTPKGCPAIIRMPDLAKAVELVGTAKLTVALPLLLRLERIVIQLFVLSIVQVQPPIELTETRPVTEPKLKLVLAAERVNWQGAAACVMLNA